MKLIFAINKQDKEMIEIWDERYKNLFAVVHKDFIWDKDDNSMQEKLDIDGNMTVILQVET